MITTEHAVRVFDEGLQQPIFTCAQIDDDTLFRYQMAGISIERPIGESYCVAATCIAAGTPQDTADARQQLPRVEGLSEIIIRAHFQADNPLCVFAQRRQHDHRQIGAGTQLAAQDKAVVAGQHDIENDQIDTLPLELRPHGFAILCGRDAIAIALQIVAQEIEDLGVIIHDEKVFLHRHRQFQPLRSTEQKIGAAEFTTTKTPRPPRMPPKCVRGRRRHHLGDVSNSSTRTRRPKPHPLARK